MNYVIIIFEIITTIYMITLKRSILNNIKSILIPYLFNKIESNLTVEKNNLYNFKTNNKKNNNNKNKKLNTIKILTFVNSRSNMYLVTKKLLLHNIKKYNGIVGDTSRIEAKVIVYREPYVIFFPKWIICESNYL